MSEIMDKLQIEITTDIQVPLPSFESGDMEFLNLDALSAEMESQLLKIGFISTSDEEYESSYHTVEKAYSIYFNKLFN